MDQKEVKDLLDKYNQGSLNAEDKLRLDSWYVYQSAQNLVEMPDADVKEIIGLLKTTLPLEYDRRAKTYKLWPRIAMVAAALTIVFGAWFYISQSIVSLNPVTVKQNDVSPGKQGATLTLANGKKIRLSDAMNGELAIEAGVTISKSANGRIVYQVKGSDDGGNTINTLSTAKGETYDVRLPDGTLVSLNAASSLEYPANFARNKERRVRLRGEGYFQVARDKAHPFIVKTKQQEVEVLGTHFNINAYDNESSTKTTLIEGSIRVASFAPFEGGIPKDRSSGKTEILKPNEQAVLNDGKFQVSQVDAQDAIAWKQGYFAFNSETLGEIMNRVERWYNVEVIFDDPTLKKETFIGSVSRYEHVSKVLKSLAGTNTITFKIEGKTITVNRK